MKLKPTLKYTNGKNTDFVYLCELLDSSLNEAVGGATQRAQYNQYNTLEKIDDVVLIYIEEKAIACGSFKQYSNDIAEIKRVFVQKSFRGKGLSKILMHELEKKALRKGYTKLYLETGRVLAAAVNLYQTIGYRQIENYGPYKNMEESICFEKDLTKEL